MARRTARPAVPFRNQLIDAGLANGDDREFGRDEEPVKEHQEEDAGNPPQDR